MRIRNTTDIPTWLLRDIVREVAPPGISGYDVQLRNCRRACMKGWAYSDGSAFHDTAAPFVNLYVGSARFFPRRPTGPTRNNGGYLPIPYLRNRVEALVFIAAHELRHLWQSKVKRGRRVWGARGQMSERDADAYAIRMLRQWRQKHITEYGSEVMATVNPLVLPLPGGVAPVSAGDR
jgi:hypothetical protein